MPLSKESASKDFEEFYKNHEVTVIAHTHLLNAQQNLLKDARREAQDELCRHLRFAVCKVLIEPTSAIIQQVNHESLL